MALRSKYYDSLNDITTAVQKYLNTPKPGYALFINGHWGIGKTHFIKNLHKKRTIINILKQFFVSLLKLKSKEYYPIQCYVSLFGMKSTSEIEDRILRVKNIRDKTFWFFLILCIVTIACIILLVSFPELYNSKSIFKHILVFVPIITTCITFFIFLFSNVKKAVLKVFLKNNYLVLDDLERMNDSCKTFDILAYISNFLEETEGHVILIGNEEEIKDKDDKERFQREREKCIREEILFRNDRLGVLYNVLEPYVHLEESTAHELATLLREYYSFVHEKSKSSEMVDKENHSLNYRSLIVVGLKYKDLINGREDKISKNFTIPFFFYGILIEDHDIKPDDLSNITSYALKDTIPSAVEDPNDLKLKTYRIGKIQKIKELLSPYDCSLHEKWKMLFSSNISDVSAASIVKDMLIIFNEDNLLLEKMKYPQAMTDDEAKKLLDLIEHIFEDHSLCEYYQIRDFYWGLRSITENQMIDMTQEDLCEKMIKYVDYLFKHNKFIYKELKQPRYVCIEKERGNDQFLLHLDGKLETLIQQNRIALQEKIISSLAIKDDSVLEPLRSGLEYPIFINDDDTLVAKMVEYLCLASSDKDRCNAVWKAFYIRYPAIKKSFILDFDFREEESFFRKLDKSISDRLKEKKILSPSMLRLKSFQTHTPQHILKIISEQEKVKTNRTG